MPMPSRQGTSLSLPLCSRSSNNCRVALPSKAKHLLLLIVPIPTELFQRNELLSRSRFCLAAGTPGLTALPEDGSRAARGILEEISKFLTSPHHASVVPV